MATILCGPARGIHGKLIYHCIALHWNVFMHLNLEWDCDLDYNRQRMEYGIWNIECRPNREGRDEVSESKLDLAKCKGLNQL